MSRVIRTIPPRTTLSIDLAKAKSKAAFERATYASLGARVAFGTVKESRVAPVIRKDARYRYGFEWAQKRIESGTARRNMP